ncbi:MAG: DUF1501 domain-containing protein [Planctomycetes bacterium]|nr:DUF1501 domain-containing protein [Planctomycetota bacterium]
MNGLPHYQSRRAFLSQTGGALAAFALAQLDGGGGLRHHTPRARNVIYLFLSGGASQLDLFDPKPALIKRRNETLPDSVRGAQRLTSMTDTQKQLSIAPSPFAFQRRGQCGMELSELLPNLGQVADLLCLVRTLNTEAINHEPAVTFWCSGHEFPGRPSFGAWLSYGLFCEARDLPAFVVMTPRWSGPAVDQPLYQRLWGSGFLPGKHQGVALRSSGDPVLFLRDPDGLPRDLRRAQLDTLATINEREFLRSGDPETRTRIAQYEQSFRLQSAVPDLVNLAAESPSVRALYGNEVDTPGTFAQSCLLARRLIERGTRVVQIFHRGWDQHRDLQLDLPKQCRDIDAPAAGLLLDLKQRGMLDDTLVVCASEFGRTTYAQGNVDEKANGRDHHPRCFSGWLAGGGARRGHVHGTTDEFGYNIAEDGVHVHDFNATLLHLLGFDHQQLLFQHEGRPMRLTDVAGKVVPGLIA